MNTYWKIDTYGDPLGAVQRLIQKVWREQRLDHFLAPVNGEHEANIQTRLLDDLADIHRINPFKPLMVENIARSVPQIVREHPDKRIGILVRPCEMRALIEMAKRDSFSLEQLVTICVDCLGTFPAEEYQWRAMRKGKHDGLVQESLQFSRQGGILAYRYRSACQICLAPQAEGASINVNLIGLPARKAILVSTGNPTQFDLAGMTHGAAVEEMIYQHTHTLARIRERNSGTMERVKSSLAGFMPRDINELIQQFESCGDCQKCMSICPICEAEGLRKESGNHFRLESVRRWMLSCDGCGMCESVCSRNLPLSIIFAAIRSALHHRYHYLPGRSREEPLPVT